MSEQKCWLWSAGSNREKDTTSLPSMGLWCRESATSGSSGISRDLTCTHYTATIYSYRIFNSSQVGFAMAPLSRRTFVVTLVNFRHKCSIRFRNTLVKFSLHLCLSWASYTMLHCAAASGTRVFTSPVHENQLRLIRMSLDKTLVVFDTPGN